jgi:predicted Zn-dependent protease
MNSTILYQSYRMPRLLRRCRVGVVSVLIAVTFVCMNACATSGVNWGGLNLVSFDQEWQMGQQLERELAGKLRLVNDASTVSYVNQIGQKIVRQTSLNNVPWKFHVVADKSINAFNIPGGHVYVNTGLIMASRNASELAGVMAHEIAHGVSRHATERISKVYGLNLGAGLLLGEQPSQLKQIAAQLAGGGLVAKFSRDDEREADRLGVQFMYRAGYNPTGMASMFEKLMSERKRRPSGVEQFFSTHPLTEERIATVRQQARGLPNRSGLIVNDGRLNGIRQRVSRYSG